MWKRVKLLLHYLTEADKDFWFPWDSEEESLVKNYVTQIQKLLLVFRLDVPRQLKIQLCLSRHSSAAGSSTPVTYNTQIVTRIYD